MGFLRLLRILLRKHIEWLLGFNRQNGFWRERGDLMWSRPQHVSIHRNRFHPMGFWSALVLSVAGATRRRQESCLNLMSVTSIVRKDDVFNSSSHFDDVDGDETSVYGRNEKIFSLPEIPVAIHMVVCPGGSSTRKFRSRPPVAPHLRLECMDTDVVEEQAIFYKSITICSVPLSPVKSPDHSRAPVKVIAGRTRLPCPVGRPSFTGPYEMCSPH